MLPNIALARALHEFGMATEGKPLRDVRLVLDFGGNVVNTIRFSEGQISVANLAVVAASLPAEAADNPTSVDEALLRAIDSLSPEAVISAEELADRAGHSLNGWTRERLAFLVREGRIRGHGRRGYGRVAPV